MIGTPYPPQSPMNGVTGSSPSGAGGAGAGMNGAGGGVRVTTTNSSPRHQLDPDTTKWLSGLVDDFDDDDPNGLDEDKRGASSTTGEDDGNNSWPPAAQMTNLLSSEEEQTIFTLTEQLVDWNFDVFEVCKLTNNRPLFFLGLVLFRKNDLIRKFSIDKACLCNFLTAIENGYQNDKPYHNSTHAADVTRSLHFFIHKGGLKADLTDLDVLACLIASLTHDYNHGGVNNNFLSKTHSELSLIYNDKSILENMHLSSTFKVLLQPANNILVNLLPSQYEQLRKMIIDMVLATDLGVHFEFIGHFKNALPRLMTERNTDAGKLMILKMALKCSDIAHSAKTLELHTRWSWRIIEEFFRQGDQERALGLTVSPFMDRHMPNVAKAQGGFMYVQHASRMHQR